MPTPAQSSPRRSKNEKKSRRSWAYARTVFGDRSTAAKCARNRSTGSTIPESSRTVHEGCFIPDPAKR